jgi:molecular chaperone DnaK (HSP70)
LTDHKLSFKSIDPTPCHASAHPLETGPTVGFSIVDTSSENPNTITVSEITTRHLRRLASSASDFIGKKVNAAVITVPTEFSEAQRNALIKASKDAGMEVLQMIHEPIAAVVAYDGQPDAEVKDKLVVVADLGGTRSDVAVIAARGGMYSILATAHDYELGGAQLDQVLVDHFAKEFIKKHKTDPRQNKRSLAKLKLEAEATKKALSLGGNATISIESLADGVDFSSTINRTRYELLASKVFNEFVRLIEGVIKKAELDVLDIDEVRLEASPDEFRYLLCTVDIIRRHIPHPKGGPEIAVPLPRNHTYPLALHFSHRHEPLRPQRKRCRHPSLSNSRVRQGGHRTIDPPNGHRHAPYSERDWCSPCF